MLFVAASIFALVSAPKAVFSPMSPLMRSVLGHVRESELRTKLPSLTLS